jgi:hypothetical protein
VGCGGAGGQAHGLTRQDEFGSGQADVAFFDGKALFSGQERAVVAERLVKKRLDQRAKSRRMLGAEEPATASSSSMVAVPALSRNLTICSERRLIDSDILREILLCQSQKYG